MVSAILLMACESQSNDESRHFCDNEKALLRINAVDTAIWDLELSMDSLLLDILNQTGIDSCDGSQNIYLQVELPEFGETFIPARVGNPYCSCCPDVPPGHSRTISIYLHGDSILLSWNHIAKNKIKNQLISETNVAFIESRKRLALYKLKWDEYVKDRNKASFIQTLLTSYFTALEQKYAFNNQSLCTVESVSEMPKLVLIIEKYAVPPPPPPIPDSINDSGNMN